MFAFNLPPERGGGEEKGAFDTEGEGGNERERKGEVERPLEEGGGDAIEAAADPTQTPPK